MSGRFVIENACVLTQNERREVIARASVLVEDGRVAQVSASKISAGAARVIDAERAWPSCRGW